MAEASTSRSMGIAIVVCQEGFQNAILESDAKTCILRVRKSKTVKIKELSTKSDFHDASKKKGSVGARIG